MPETAQKGIQKITNNGTKFENLFFVGLGPADLPDWTGLDTAIHLTFLCVRDLVENLNYHDVLYLNHNLIVYY